MSVLIRKSLFVVFGAFILVSPVFPQVFKIGQPWIRQWTMFSGVGTGLMKGEFQVQYQNGETANISPLEFMGLTRYPNTFDYEFQRRILSVKDLERLGQVFCDGHENIASLTYTGRIGIPTGWANLTTENLCKAEGQLNV